MKLTTKYKLKKRGMTGTKPRKNAEKGRVRNALEQSRVIKALIGISSCAGVIAILLLGKFSSTEQLDLYVGQPAPVDVFVDAGFSFENREETSKLRREAADKVLPRYRFSLEKLKSCAGALKEIVAGTGGDETAGTVPEEGKSLSGQIIEGFDLAGLDRLKQAQEPVVVAEEIGKFLESCANERVPAESEINEALGRVDDDEAGERYKKALLLVAEEKAVEWVAEKFGRERRVREAALEVITNCLRKSVEYDELRTSKLKESKAEEVAPVISTIQPGRKIIERGYEITPQQMDIYHAYREKREELNPPGARMLQRLYYFIGLALLVGAFFIVTNRFLKLYQKRIYESNSTLFMLELIVIGALLVSRGITVIPFGLIQSDWINIFYYFAVISVPAAAILISLLLNRAVAPFFVVVLGILIGIMKGFSLDYAIVSVIGGVMAVYATEKVRRRSQLLKSGFTVALANVVTVGALDVIGNVNIFTSAVGYEVGGSFLVGILSAFVAASVLPLFEYVFNIVTDIRFLELSDLDHPLLRKMLLQAPGTYHHSLMVGTLGEAGAEAVGANPLQVKVCAYFHDVGKLKKPQYFSENEEYGKSKHDELSPSMSGLIIIAHVKDGVDMAVKNKLNRVIIDGIREHHGSGLVYFFYRRAEENKSERQLLSQEDFRYPGPKPQSKETAILLLADAVEAASRSLERPTPSRIRNLVRDIINVRFMDGQLDECDLTFRDLHKIAGKFEQILNGTFHARVKYPENGSKSNEGYDTKHASRQTDQSHGGQSLR